MKDYSSGTIIKGKRETLNQERSTNEEVLGDQL